MPTSDPRIYAFGPFVLNPSEQLLLRGDEPVHLRSKPFAALAVLVARASHVVGKDELMQLVWPGAFVEENNLSQCIAEIRRCLGQRQDGSSYVETVTGRGYRFTAPVVLRRTEPEPLRQQGIASTPQALRVPPVTRYARSGDVNIAYQTVGDGPQDLVFVMGWVSHLDYFWTQPLFARFLDRLASFSRLILFDKRGTGLSDRVPLHALPTLEQRMDDVRVVMDAVGSERATLCGVSEGGPLCALFAATYPERTRALVMIGTYATRLKQPDYPWGADAEEQQRWLDNIRDHWGGSVGLSVRAPSMSTDPEFRQWWGTYLRHGASPGAAVALTSMNMQIDVRHVLPNVRVPTLVLHRVDERVVQAEEARYIASHIPGATLVELPGEDHLPFVGDQDRMLDEIETFMTGVTHSDVPDTVLATILAATVIGGPDEGRDVMSPIVQYDARAKREIARFRGRDLSPGSGRFLASFDGPSRAIRCACTMRDMAGRSGLALRAGLHTGECDADATAGPALEIAERVAARARPGEVLVSNTVRGLVSAPDLQFGHWGARVPADEGGGRLYTVRTTHI